MPNTNNKKFKKGFTLIEVLLVMALIAILITISLTSLNIESRFIDSRNDVRKNNIQTIEGAVSQYRLQEGSYPTGLDRTYREICDPDALSCTGFFNLKTFLVPKYLQAIPQDPNDTDNVGGSGYSLAIDSTTNTISVRALQAESGINISVNDPLPAQENVATNTRLFGNIITSGLVLRLDAGDTASYTGSGTTWLDLSGNNNNATLVNGVGYNSSEGGVLVFDGVNDYISINNASTLNLSSGLTVSIWFYSGTSTPSILYLKGTGVDPDQYNPLLRSNGYYAWTAGAFIRAQYNPPVNFILPNTWYNLTVSHTSGSNPSIYKNSILSTSHTYIEGSGATALGTNTNPVGINIDIPRGTIDNFNGRISSIFVYNRSLTATEVQQNFDAIKGRFGL
jgi:prepilin-type N-terminal cleavage/methylation domain-containing protein